MRIRHFRVTLSDMKREDVREYRMSARADAAALTGDRILDAAVALFWEQPANQLSLEDVARRAEVSVRTVIRRFGGRDGLMAAAAARETERTELERDAPVGDVLAAVTVLIGHYERTGDRVLRMLTVEGDNARLHVIADRGRSLHRDWCRTVFAPSLTGLTALERKRRLAQLVAVCDVSTWKLLRRDSGLSRAQTELAMVELVRPLTQEV